MTSNSCLQNNNEWFCAADNGNALLQFPRQMVTLTVCNIMLHVQWPPCYHFNSKTRLTSACSEFTSSTRRRSLKLTRLLAVLRNALNTLYQDVLWTGSKERISVSIPLEIGPLKIGTNYRQKR